MPDTKLIIIRHARSMNNVRLSEGMDPPITDFGARQARNVGKFLAKHAGLDNWFSYYTSPFLRCLQTARGIMDEINRADSGGYHRKFTVKPEVREYINHCAHEAKISNHSADFADMWWSHPELTQGEIFYKDEFNEEFLNRMHQFYRNYCHGHKVVVVTHGLPAFLLLNIAKDNNINSAPIWDHSIDNCSMSLVVNGRAVWHGRNLYHEVEHDPYDTKRPYDAADLLVPKS